MNSSEYTDVRDRLERIETLTRISAKNVLDIDEAVLLTGYSRSYLYRLTSLRLIPHYKRDRKLFFKKAELEKWLTGSPITTTQELVNKHNNNH